MQLLVALLSLFNASQSYALTVPTDLQNHVASIDARYVTTRNVLDIDQVRALEDDVWTALESPTLNTGITKKNLWLRINIILKSAQSGIDNVTRLSLMGSHYGDVHIFSDDIQVDGNSAPNKATAINGNWQHTFHNKQWLQHTYYVNISSPYASHITFAVDKPKATPLLSTTEKTQIMTGSMFIFAVLVALIIGLQQRSATFFSLALLLVSTSALYLAITPVGLHWIWSDKGEWHHHILVVATGLYLMSSSLFSSLLFSFKDEKTTAAFIFKLCAFLSVIIPGALWVADETVAYVTALATISVLALLQILSVLARYAQLNRPIMYITTSLGVLCLSLSYTLSELALISFPAVADAFGPTALIAIIASGYFACALQHIQEVIYKKQMVDRTRFAEATRHADKQSRSLTEANARYQSLMENYRESEAILDETIKDKHDLQQKLSLAQTEKAQALIAMADDVLRPLDTLKSHRQSIKQSDMYEHHRLKVIDAVSQLDETYKDLFDYSRLHKNTLKARKEKVYLPDVFSELGKRYEDNRMNGRVQVEFQSAMISISTDPVILKRILEILVDNAITHANASHIIVRALLDGKEVNIEVFDDGRGIDLEDQSHIFEAFYKHNDSPSVGQGLGLTLVKRMSEILGHSIALVSAPNQGATFTITADVSSYDETLEPLILEEFETPSDQRKKVQSLPVSDQLLLVNIEPMLCHRLEVVLKRHNLKYRKARDAHVAHQLIDNGFHPSLVVFEQHHSTEISNQMMKSLQDTLETDVPFLVLTEDGSYEPLDHFNARVLRTPANDSQLIAAVKRCLIPKLTELA